jgi:hypothetical protein
MKETAVAAVAASVFVTVSAFAIPIQVDLGPSDVALGAQVVSFAAPDVQFQGQNLGIDFTFQNAQFIRLFTQTNFFSLDVFFRINNATSLPMFTGTGYASDQQGGALGPPATVQAFPVTNGASEIIGMDFDFTPVINNARPVDIYDLHLDLTLPDSPTFGFGSGPFGGIVLGANILGIGPDIPADVIPETGASIGLFALGIAVLIAARVLETLASATQSASNPRL